MKLVICEKPSVGANIALALNIRNKQQGYFEDDEFIISWCIGHLFQLAEPEAYDEKYKQWKYEDLPIFPEKFKYVLDKAKKEQFEVLKSLMQRDDVTTVVNACDAGREGELIFRLVYEEANCKKPIERLWISSMEDKAIQEGFESLKPGEEYDSLFESALCRSKADWLVGYNMTRLFTCIYHNGTALRVGRVQTPTLRMIVDRQDKIDNFIKEKYHLLHLFIDGADAVSERYTDEQCAVSTLDELRGKPAICKSVETQKKTNKPPKLYDLTTLQREANRLFSYTANKTLELAQSLYEKKLITYPRTDSKALTSDMSDTALNIINIVKTKQPFTRCKEFTPNVKALINDKDVSDHHAIIPTNELEKFDLDTLPSEERQLLLLIMSRILSTSSESYIYEAISSKFECNGIAFTAKGKHTLQEGFKDIEQIFKGILKNKDKYEEEEEQTLPSFMENQSYNPESVSMSEHFTTPPKAYTEDTLLSAMENAGAEDMPEEAERKGLGTPATRASIIERLIQSRLIERSGKSLIPTQIGKNLIQILPEELKSPQMTAEWEDNLLKIAKNEFSSEEFLNFLQINIVETIKTNSNITEEGRKLFMVEKESLGKCPRCGSDVYESGSNFYCGNRECKFVMYKNNKFWTNKKKQLTSSMVKSLLEKGRVNVKGLYSEKSGKKYDAIVVLDDTGDKYVNFKLEYNQKQGGK